MGDRAGIYVHVPFCARVCPYCDFAVEVDADGAHAAYLAALEREIALTPEDPGAADTVYLGGGTPSRLEPDAIARILFAIAARWRLANDTWITLEANPEDVTPEAARAWRALGVGTVSLGVQSFDEAELRFLGRAHRAVDADRAFHTIRAAGITIVSLDLIFGLPGQREDTWRASLERAAALEPRHVSCYQLTVHEGTPFGERAARGRLTELDEDRQATYYALAHEVLGAHGLVAYEVSNFAAGPAWRSRHNAKYWRHAPYVGLGPSAHSYLDGRRWWNARDRAGWQRTIAAGALPRAGSETLSPADLALERIMLGLRTADGVDLAEVAAATGLPVDAHNAELVARWAIEGLVRRDGSRVRPTSAGMAIAESLARAIRIPEVD